MIFYSGTSENCDYGFYLVDSKNVLNTSMCISSELCFDSKNSFKNYNTIGLLDSIESMDSAFLKDCINCNNCFGSINLRNGKYIFFNEQLSKDKYLEKMKEIDLGSARTYKYWQDKANEHYKKYPPKPLFSDRNVDVTGSYIFDSKNAKECYEVVGIEDSKFIMLIGQPSVKDSYDFTHWGRNVSFAYESITAGDGAYQVKFNHEVGHDITEIEYSKLSTGSSYHFGCVSMKKTNYCILNKQYSKEGYIRLREKIIRQMDEIPYIDKKGNIYKYGEFFPPEFSPHSYNNTFANLFFPKTKQEVVINGLRFYEPDPKEYPITVKALDLPDNIKGTDDEILKEVIECESCKRGYKFIKHELDLSRRMNVPLSRLCPFCRINEKAKKWVAQMKQIDRICNKCGDQFKTHYSKDEAPLIYCKKCYQQEVY